MDQDDILTFRAPAREPDRVEATPSAVLEMAYAAHAVVKRGLAPSRSATTPTWLRRLAQDAPEPLLEVEGFWRRRGFDRPGVETFVLAAHFGYERDDDPERFLGDVPVLVERFLAEGSEGGDADDPDVVADVRARIERLRDPATAQAWVGAHRGLWQRLAPFWLREGRPAAQAAAEAFLDAYRAQSSVLAALPPHHFVQFEAAAPSIRKAEAEGKVLVVPLGLAVAGGFRFDDAGTLFIGFGLQIERVHARASARVAELAGRMKVFADPTRAMLLALIGRFSGIQMTVGDLAQQLGVSQPTVSGHLRLLREAGLVEIERRGNKAFHRIDADAVTTLLSDFSGALIGGNGGAEDTSSA